MTRRELTSRGQQNLDQGRGKDDLPSIRQPQRELRTVGRDPAHGSCRVSVIRAWLDSSRAAENARPCHLPLRATISKITVTQRLAELHLRRPREPRPRVQPGVRRETILLTDTMRTTVD
jgi:hypothetical protein